MLLTMGYVVAISATSRLAMSVSADSVEQKVPFSEYTHIYKNRCVSSTYPVLKKYKPIYQPAVVNGKNYTRLMVYSEKGQLSSLCNELRRNKEECFLK